LFIPVPFLFREKILMPTQTPSGSFISHTSEPLAQEARSPRPGRRPGAQPGNSNGGAVFAPPSRPHETQSPRPGRLPGAQPGNSNALKHGFYTRRFKKHDLSGVENINIKGLAEEIALIRIFTRRLIEACDPSADVYDLAGILRAICLASDTITRIIRVQYLLGNSSNELSASIDEAIRQIGVEFGIYPPSPTDP
jgi:hypothetical protein